MNCNGVVGKDCADCNQPCIMKFSDAEWKAYSRFSRDIVSALDEMQIIEDDIDEYWKIKQECNRKGLVVDEVVNINISYLRKRKSEVEQRLKKLRKMEYYYTKKLLELQKE